MDASELTTRREALGLSTYDLARELGVAPSSVHRWERGEVALHGLTAIGADTVLRRLERRQPRRGMGEKTGPAPEAAPRHQHVPVTLIAAGADRSSEEQPAGELPAALTSPVDGLAALLAKAERCRQLGDADGAARWQQFADELLAAERNRTR